MFWLLTVCLFLLASMFVVIPLWLRTTKDSFESQELRKSTNISLFHERNDELEKELAAGNIDQDQYNSLVLELQRSLLIDVRTDGVEPQINSKQVEEDLRRNGKAGEKSRSIKPKNSKSQGIRDTSIIIPAVITVLMPFVAYQLYNQWGYIDDVELMGLFERTVENGNNPEDAQALIVSLGQVVQEDEERTWAWYFLAENFGNIGMFGEAQIAYERAANLLDDVPEKAFVLGRVAVAMYINADLELTSEILKVIEQARAINPNEISILQLLASDALQQEDYVEAIGYWRLLIQADPNSSQAQTLRSSIAAVQQLLAQEGQNVPGAVEGPVINVNLSLVEGLELNDELRVFVAARNAAQEGLPPLAARDLRVFNLPATIRLDDGSAVGPFNLTSAETVYISALVSNAGIAAPQSGDYRVTSESFALNGETIVIDLVIAERVQ